MFVELLINDFSGEAAMGFWIPKRKKKGFIIQYNNNITMPNINN